MRPRGRAGESEHRGFLNAIGADRPVNGIPGIGVGEVVGGPHGGAVGIERVV